jgi:beta-lactamase class A
MRAATFIEARAPVWSVAVASPAEGVLYAENGDVELELASVVKVLVALAVMDVAQQEKRYVDRFELSLLWPMITLSDNDSATALWDQIGGGRGLAAYLSSIGATGIRPYDGPFWGTTTASATSLAVILARAAFGDLLNAEHRSLFLNLLQKVTPSQRWGVSAGAEGEAGTGATVGIKDGWFPADAGWRVNSLGFVFDARRAYTLAVLSNAQPSWEYGIETIEGVAAEVNSVLLR